MRLDSLQLFFLLLNTKSRFFRISAYVPAYRQAALNAVEAGFDGVEIRSFQLVLFSSLFFFFSLSELTTVISRICTNR